MSSLCRSSSLAKGRSAPTRTPAGRCRASKGFGSVPAKSKGPGSKAGHSKTPQQAADRALSESKGHARVRPIDPNEAARGKVDYVQVKDWANGQAGDIGELQVVAGSVGTGFSTGGAGGGAVDASAPFFQQLGEHAQYLECQGALSIAEERNAKPYLPFESWQYSLRRYRQYLAEVAAVHLALESALKLALSPPAVPAAAAAAAAGSSDDAHSPGSSSSSDSVTAGWAVPGREGEGLQAYAALQCFGPDSGLWRAAAAQADLQALSTAAAGEADPQHKHQQPQQQLLGGTSAVAAAGEGPHASQNAVAYGRYLLQLGRAAAAATQASAAAAAAASSSKSDALVAEATEGATAALKLLAHAYALQVQAQCLGTRIGAVATDKLQLLQSRAVAMYLDYPGSIRGEPVQQLVSITDAAGRQLGAVGRQAVLQELPKALKKSALMLAPLATAD